ncbi:MAG: hypothetical protein ACXVLT_00585 [Flavisolibacter sp.]
MKRQNLQSSRHDTENKQQDGHKQIDVSNKQQKDTPRPAGLGRDRMSESEDPGEMSRRDDYAGGDRDDISVEDSDDALA